MSLRREYILERIAHLEALADAARIKGQHQVKVDLRAEAFKYRRMLEHAK